MYVLEQATHLHVTLLSSVQEKVGASHCVDIATLTGAQIIALGGGIGAVMSPSDSAAARVISAGNGTGGEKWWQLPLENEYFEQLKSKVRRFDAEVVYLETVHPGCHNACIFFHVSESRSGMFRFAPAAHVAVKRSLRICNSGVVLGPVHGN